MGIAMSTLNLRAFLLLSRVRHQLPCIFPRTDQGSQQALSYTYQGYPHEALHSH